MKTITILALSLLIHSNTWACSCGKVKIKGAFNGADLIFIGKVISAEKVISLDSIKNLSSESEKTKFYIHEYRVVNYTFAITELIKGKPITSSVIITTTGGGADCGNIFEVGSEHLVYSYLHDKKLGFYSDRQPIKPFYTTSICTRTNELKFTRAFEKKKLKRLQKNNKTANTAYFSHLAAPAQT